jgi:hypothetical protein
MVIVVWTVFNGLRNCESCHRKEHIDEHVHIQ